MDNKNNRNEVLMTQLTEEHFELHTQNKAERYERQKIKFLEDRIATLEKALESHTKILARFQMMDNEQKLYDDNFATEGQLKRITEGDNS